MIFFKAKPAAAPAPSDKPTIAESGKRVEDAASAKRKKSDTNGTPRRQRQTTDDNKLL